ncbi:MAG: inosine/xanthosine triphosphatase [Methanomassiliicoccaceae archaeon]|nr:inosine/xanthosine triphosphatase [Methanomassiliicoccaceae archaeon]
MRSVVAGTFDVLHEGHRRLIRRAFEAGDEVLVGITSDGMASSKEGGRAPIHLRRRELEAFLCGMGKPWEVVEISDMYGPRDKMDASDVLVVSEETAPNAELVNRERASRGVRPFEVVVVPLVAASDGGKISSAGVLRGDYSREGRSDAVRVAVGSLNRVKVEAVRAVMERVFGSAVIVPVRAGSGVPDQPWGPETRSGAVNRAVAALGDRDLSVGIEAGVFPTEDGLYDFQYCAVLDKGGRMTVGVGPGFRYPDEVAALVSGGMTVGEAVERLHGDADIGMGQGAVGLLSMGLLDRKALTEQAVVAAMVPRMAGLRPPV